MTTQTTGGPDEVLATPINVLVAENGGFTRTARAAGIDDAVLWRAMTGRRSPRYETRLKLARAFKCRIDEIVFPADERS